MDLHNQQEVLVHEQEEQRPAEVILQVLGAAPALGEAEVTSPSCSAAPSEAPPLEGWLTCRPEDDWALLVTDKPPAAVIAKDAPLRTAYPSPTCQKLEEAGGSAQQSDRQATRRSLDEAKQLLQALTHRHKEAEAENARLKSRNKHVLARIGQAEFQQRMNSVIQRAPRDPVPLPASCSQVSFSELPPSSRWDAAWIARIKQLKAQDYLALRRQWVQRSAVLLPVATMYGPGSTAYCELEEMHSKHMDLHQAMVKLCPGVYLESSQYDADTLRPIETPSAEWTRDLFTHLCPPEAAGGLIALALEFHSSASSLHDECHGLLQRYNALAQALELQQLDLGRRDGAWQARFDLQARGSQQLVLGRLRLDCSPQYMELLEQLEETAKLLQANASKQKAALLEFFNAFSLEFHQFHLRRINFVIMMLPLAFTSLDFVPALLLLGDAARTDPSTSGRPASPA